MICLFGHGWITRHWTLCHNISLGFATSTWRINGRMAQFKYCVWTLTIIVVLVSSLFYVCNLLHKWKNVRTWSFGILDLDKCDVVTHNNVQKEAYLFGVMQTILWRVCRTWFPIIWKLSETFNEIQIFATWGYWHGTFALGRCSPPFGNCAKGNSFTEPYTLAHNAVIAHALAINIYWTRFQVNFC